MNIVCGVLRQTKGEVWIDGINTLGNPIEARRRLGFLPQKAPLYPDLTVEEYLRFCAEMRLVAPREISRAVERAEELCGVTHFKDRLLRNLSGGYQQRVGIAQAILHDPKLVILDEPSVYLDIAGREFLLATIAELAQSRPELTIIFITQRIEDILPDFNRGMILRHGEIICHGSRDDVLTEPNLQRAFELPIRLIRATNGRLWTVIE